MSLHALQSAIFSLNTPDAFKPRLNSEQWGIFAAYLTRQEVKSGELLVKQGELDRTLYLLESGTLQVYLSAPKPGVRLSILRAGAVVGEAGLFSNQPRMANVAAVGPCVVWALLGSRYEEMAARSPALALELVRAAALLMGVRMRANLELRHAIS
jgi:CRP/FNR family transcriptional regulator, cyclic AMP receptor protein